MARNICACSDSYSECSDDLSEAGTDEWLEMQELKNDLNEEWRALEDFTRARQILKEALQSVQCPSSEETSCVCPTPRYQRPQRHGRNLKEQMFNVRRQKIPSAIQEYEEPEDEGLSGMAPRIIASILHMEEKGMPLDQSPETVYSYLFNEQQEEPVLITGPAAPSHPKDIVVPLSVPSETQLCESVHNIGIAASAVSSASNRPKDSIFSEHMPKIPGKGTEETAEQRSIVQPGLDFNLQTQPSRNVTKVQIRGSVLPPWFPGYYSSFEGDERMCLSSTPSKTVHKAWKLMASGGNKVNILTNVDF
ncbi:uncharacterized protein LOC124606689 isoform X1 [Schistocerca americana]|uniref:uncharacterized protein LOC124606689 isoform X1 n=2 Tax=Schistocerca americana TaxID=7009 RepID=UPI001F4F3890|nr:uncharacterized protein LOC124606689 isoform X1 [Schistocerca americana]XP_049956481.1 uncharacterized protein LOC126473461 isoform X1 [Schistocerca serialis cubense]